MKGNGRQTDESWLRAQFRDWLDELKDEQIWALSNNWDNIMDDAALDRIDSWIAANKALTALRQAPAGNGSSADTRQESGA